MTSKRESSKGRELPREETKQEAVEEVKIDVAEPAVVEEVKAPAREMAVPMEWSPKTELGKAVMAGKITSVDEVFAQGMKISEPEIVDALIPELNKEIILIGGSTGKGGGIRRTPSKRTTRMHKSGRRFRLSVMVVVGNGNGYIGVGLAKGPPGKQRDVADKALNKAKLNIIPIRRGCGSWECNCGGHHSIPFGVSGKAGSVRIELLPAPKGVGLCISNETKKMMRLAGITDIWCKSRGQTQTRVNLINATFAALRNLNRFRIQEKYEKVVGLRGGRC